MTPADPAALANHLWQSSLFAAVAGLLTLALRRNAAQTRYWVWLAASAKFLFPFSWLIDVGDRLGRHTAPALLPRYFYALDQASQPFVGMTPGPVTPLAPVAQVNWLAVTLVTVWTVGVAALLCCWWRRWRSIRTMLRSASPIDLPNGVSAMISPAFIEPGVFGVLHPVLLLPAGIIEHLAPPELDAIVAHELCHMRRRDNLAAAMHMFVETLFWFHPLVWWLGARLMQERERACDEEVLRTGSRPEAYAEGILKVCELYLESPLLCVSGVTGANLRKRIEQIMGKPVLRRLTRSRKLLLGAAFAAAIIVPILTGILDAPAIEAQVATGPRFEVVSVKRCEAGAGRMRSGERTTPSTLRVGCDLLADENGLGLIQGAYVRFAGGRANPMGVVPIVGGPNWIHTDAYSIQANAEGHPSEETMQGPMFQALLEDRFKLKIHRETRQGPVYALTRAGGALKLKPFPEGSCLERPVTRPAPPPPAGKRYCDQQILFVGPSLKAEGVTLIEFSKLLNLILDRPVVDQTGLTGRFNIHLEFARDQATARLPEGFGGEGTAPPPSDPSRPTIFTAVQEQLGLKLMPARGPVESLVIDHIERPSEN